MGVRRDHEFTGVDVGPTPTLDELIALVERIDHDFENQRQRLLLLYNWLEEAVTDRVHAEMRAEESENRIDQLHQQLKLTERELEALRNTKLLRTVAPLRNAYARVRRAHD